MIILMNILIIDNGSKHITEIVSCFKGHEVKVLKYRRHSNLDREWADLFLLSGGNKPVLFKQFFRKELKLIQETNKPLIGICLGFELIAEAYGAKLKRHKIKIRGIKEIKVVPEYFGFESTVLYEVFEAHRWVLTDKSNFEIVGTSNRGPEIIKHPSRRIMGLQFHPEITVPINDGQLLLNRSIQLLTQE